MLVSISEIELEEFSGVWEDCKFLGTRYHGSCLSLLSLQSQAASSLNLHSESSACMIHFNNLLDYSEHRREKAEIITIKSSSLSNNAYTTTLNLLLLHFISTVQEGSFKRLRKWRAGNPNPRIPGCSQYPVQAQVPGCARGCGVL